MSERESFHTHLYPDRDVNLVPPNDTLEKKGTVFKEGDRVLVGEEVWIFLRTEIPDGDSDPVVYAIVQRPNVQGLRPPELSSRRSTKIVLNSHNVRIGRFPIDQISKVS